jgi:hypothetical protein
MLRDRNRRSRHDPPEQSLKLLFRVQTIDMSLKKKRKNNEKIRRVGEILDEFLIGNLESEFPVGGPSEESHGAAEREFPVGAPLEPREVVEQQRADVEEQQADEGAEDEAYDDTQYYFDLADVEYCVDAAITEIIKENLVPGYNNPQKSPTLSEMFQELFGEDHKLTKLVEEFEEYISGYEDQVHIDDLKEARKVMRVIIKELEDWGGKQSG